MFVQGRPGYPIDDAAGTAGGAARRGRATRRRSDRRRVAVVGTRAATPHGLDGRLRARCGSRPGRGHGGERPRDRDRRRRARGRARRGRRGGRCRRRPGSTSSTRGGTACCSTVCAASGLLVSELALRRAAASASVPGAQPDHRRVWRRSVVVVEATLKGGARITAEHALEYGRTVMAYPGSRRNPSAAGTNALLYDGARSCSSPPTCWSRSSSSTAAPRLDLRTPPVGEAAAVLRACHGEPATLDQLASRTATRAVDAWSRRCGRSSATVGWSAHAACAGRDDGDAPVLAGELRVALLHERAQRLLGVAGC